MRNIRFAARVDTRASTITRGTRDDLESLSYVLVYFARGSLPWQGLKATTDKEKQDLVKNMKISLPAEKLYDGLPDALV
ncbi:hypothetical protein F4779DRAFT_624568 [Xylariaceae sp. FL0662B]|nr:hypothetical protein F4779DRAFT_624568 [Xylariaceae sp. FL0662B]